MADLPERRIDDRHARSDHLPVVKIGDQAEQAGAKLAHGCDQLAHAHGGEGTGSCAGDRRWHLGICREIFLTDSIHQEFILLDLMDIATRHKPEISFNMAGRHGANSFTQRRPRFRSM